MAEPDSLDPEIGDKIRGIRGVFLSHASEDTFVPAFKDLIAKKRIVIKFDYWLDEAR